MIKIGEGETSEVYRIEGGKVLKLFREDMFDQEDFFLEYHTAKHLGDTTEFAPKVYDQVTVNSRRGYTMEEVDGMLFQDEIEDNKDRLRYYANLLGQMHRQLHDKKVTPELCELNDCKTFFRSFLNRNTCFSKDINSWLLELLENIPSKQSLLHGDFMPYNMMIKNGKLQVLDWAEPSLGPAVFDIARTINFIVDTTDYPTSVMTKNAVLFTQYYLKGYYKDETIDKEIIHKGLLLNAATEVAWAERSNQSDEYSEYLKMFILDNYHSEDIVYMEAIKNIK
ncbi:MAG: phosphotransferase [Clostridiales bacterium]|nr:phosphotransferase [Clostridiales bacterium]